METIAKNFIIQISIITASFSYCYFISSKLPKGIYRFISLIPVFYIFTILPLHCTSIFTTAITFSFFTWLTNFKLIRFAFDLEQSPYYPSISLLNFIIFTSLPIKSKRNSTSIKTPFLYKLGFQILIFSILVQIVLDYRIRAHHNILFIIYCGLLFLIIDIVSALVNALVFMLTGFELEPLFNKPYVATSLQNFWGRCNLVATNTLRYTVYKPVVTVFPNNKLAPLAGILASFIVSGLMHELLVYQLSGEEVTWEMTWFFVIHGICVIVEVMIKRRLTGRRWRLPEFVATVLTMGFVAVTGFWLFFPPFVRRRLDVKTLHEFKSVVDFIKARFSTLIIQYA